VQSCLDVELAATVPHILRTPKRLTDVRQFASEHATARKVNNSFFIDEDVDEHERFLGSGFAAV